MPRKKHGIVVVAEDAESIRHAIVQYLVRAGFAVSSAGNGQEAFDLIHRNPGPYYVLIADLDMPEKSGDELIRDLDSGPVNFSAYVLISGHTIDYPPIAALRAHPTRAPMFFLPKPFDPDALSALLDSIKDSYPIGDNK